MMWGKAAESEMHVMPIRKIVLTHPGFVEKDNDRPGCLVYFSISNVPDPECVKTILL
jgi:hypothetical protein